MFLLMDAEKYMTNTELHDKVSQHIILFIVMLINVLENKIKTSGYYSYEKYIPILVEGKNALLRTPSLKRKMLVFNMFYKIYQTNKVA